MPEKEKRPPLTISAELLNPGEIAVPLADAPNYCVTSHGRFYSLAGRRWLRLHLAQGRPTALLNVEGKETRRAAALLVALHFPEICGSAPDGPNPRVMQSDNDPMNCRADNLTWGSHRELLQRRAKGRQEQGDQNPSERKMASRRSSELSAAEAPFTISYAMDWLLKQGRNALPASDPTTGNVFYYLDSVFNSLCAECATVRVRRCLAAGKADDAMPIEQLILWPAKPHLGWAAHWIDCADCQRRVESGAGEPELS